MTEHVFLIVHKLYYKKRRNKQVNGGSYVVMATDHQVIKVGV